MGPVPEAGLRGTVVEGGAGVEAFDGERLLVCDRVPEEMALAPEALEFGFEFESGVGVGFDSEFEVDVCDVDTGASGFDLFGTAPAPMLPSPTPSMFCSPAGYRRNRIPSAIDTLISSI